MNIQSFCSLNAEEIAKMPDKIIEISLSQKEPYTIYQYNLPSLDFDCYSVHSPFYDAHGFSIIDMQRYNYIYSLQSIIVGKSFILDL